MVEVIVAVVVEIDRVDSGDRGFGSGYGGVGRKGRRCSWSSLCFIVVLCSQWWSSSWYEVPLVLDYAWSYQYIFVASRDTESFLIPTLRHSRL